MKDFETVIAFWFNQENSKYWFVASAEFDETIHQKFGQLHETACSHTLDHWKTQPLSNLALVIVLDQFSRNLYRNNARAFVQDHYAKTISTYAVNNKLDAEFTDSQKSFLYMPFMHSESLEDQEKSVELFKGENLKHSLPYAIEHRNIIKQFGRFPHRNEILGRTSTEAELDYLNSPNAFKG